MAADGNLLQGEVTENPANEEKDVEKLLSAFMRALVEEQKSGKSRSRDIATNRGPN